MVEDFELYEVKSEKLGDDAEFDVPQSPEIQQFLNLNEAKSLLITKVLKDFVRYENGQPVRVAGYEVDAAELQVALETRGGFELFRQLQTGNRNHLFSYLAKACRLDFDSKIAIKQAFTDWDKRQLTVSHVANDKAKYPDYIKLFETTFPGARKDLLSGRIMVQHQNSWKPCLNLISQAVSIAMDDNFYAANKVRDHFNAWQASLTGEIITDALIPEWDKRDRLSEITTCLTAHNMSQTTIYELLCDWGAKSWRRKYDCYVRNRIFIFQGAQHLGKDWLIDALVSGYDDSGLGYVSHTRLDNDGEIDQKLHKSLIFNISEFDRTSKVLVSQLKHLITTAYVDERLKYDASSENRACRGSFIASANPRDLLRDPTGSSRYIVVELSAVDWNYPGARGRKDWQNDRLQIVAQYKYLAERDYKSSKIAETELSEYLTEMEPGDAYLDFVSFFDRWANDHAQLSHNGKKIFEHSYFKVADMGPFFEAANKQFKFSRGEAMRRLQMFERRTRKASGYVFKFKDLREEDSEEEFN